jgi:hypothetical protein
MNPRPTIPIRTLTVFSLNYKRLWQLSHLTGLMFFSGLTEFRDDFWDARSLPQTAVLTPALLKKVYRKGIVSAGFRWDDEGMDNVRCPALPGDKPTQNRATGARGKRQTMNDS